MKKLLDFDWLIAAQFKQKEKKHIVILNSEWFKDNMKFSKPMISRKMITKFLCGNFEKRFLKYEKKKVKKHLPGISPHNFFFHVYIINK